MAKVGDAGAVVADQRRSLLVQDYNFFSVL
jgi:hypothetical protein